MDPTTAPTVDLDRWAAERIMRWTQETGFSYWPNEEMVYRTADGERRGTVADWHPTTDWGQAGQVLDAARALGWIVGLHAWPGEAYRAVAERADGAIGPTWHRRAATGPAAICAVLYAALTGQRTQERPT